MTVPGSCLGVTLGSSRGPSGDAEAQTKASCMQSMNSGHWAISPFPSKKLNWTVITVLCSIFRTYTHSKWEFLLFDQHILNTPTSQLLVNCNLAMYVYEYIQGIYTMYFGFVFLQHQFAKICQYLFSGELNRTRTILLSYLIC